MKPLHDKLDSRTSALSIALDSCAVIRANAGQTSVFLFLSISIGVFGYSVSRQLGANELDQFLDLAAVPALVLLHMWLARTFLVSLRPKISIPFLGDTTFSVSARTFGRTLVVILVTSMIVGLGAMFFVIPGIILAKRWLFVLPVTMCEAKSGHLERSREIGKAIPALWGYATLWLFLAVGFEVFSYWIRSAPSGVDSWALMALAESASSGVDAFFLAMICVLYAANVRQRGS